MFVLQFITIFLKNWREIIFLMRKFQSMNIDEQVLSNKSNVFMLVIKNIKFVT